MFVDQQLHQVNEVLDVEWAEHIEKTKAKVRFPWVQLDRLRSERTSNNFYHG